MTISHDESRLHRQGHGLALLAFVLGMVLTVGPALAATVPSNYAYDLNFSSYFGGSGMDLLRAMAIDSQGNVYVAGIAGSSDFPRKNQVSGAVPGETTANAPMAMVAKFSSTGSLIWSKVFGTTGECYFYSVHVDGAGYVYVAGRMGPGFPTTANAFQKTTTGGPSGGTGFVAKLKPDASGWVWCSYVGVGYAMRDMTMDDNGDIYGILDYYQESKDVLPASWFTNALDKKPHPGKMNHFGHSDAGLIKISNDGRVLWATWIGGSNGNDWAASLGVGTDHCPVILLATASVDMPVTANAFCKTPAFNKVFKPPMGAYVAKVSADGSRLIYGSYAGVGPRTHNVAVDRQGNTFLTGCARGSFPVTAGAFQTTFKGGGSPTPEDFGIMKISPSGALLAATFIGGTGDEANGPDQIFIDKKGNVMICGCSSSTDYPVTSGAFQSTNKGLYNGVVSVFSNDLSTLLYSTYIGGSGRDSSCWEAARAGCIGPDGTVYVGGCTNSSDFPVTKNAFQSTFHGGRWDCFLTKFSPRRSVPVLPARR